MEKFNNYITKYSKLLNEAIKIDNSKWNENKSILEIKQENNLDIKLEEGKSYLVIYDGNPELTNTLLQKAIESKANIVFTIYDYFLATNKLLIKLAQNYSKENNINIFIKLYNNIYEDKIFESTKNVDETIFIGEKEEFDFIQANVHGKLTKIEF